MTPVVEPTSGILQLFGEFHYAENPNAALCDVLKRLSTRLNSCVHNPNERHSRAPVRPDEGLLLRTKIEGVPRCVASQDFFCC